MAKDPVTEDGPVSHGAFGWRLIEYDPAELLKLLIEPGTPASVRAGVADSIFDHAAKAIEIEDIEARVAALETATDNRNRD